MTGTAEVHPDATLTPSKLELVKAWLPQQAWFAGTADDTVQLGSFRFVDPAGEVGMETLILFSDGVAYQVPVTYRGDEMPDFAEFLIGEMEHSVLGHRWMYEATGDPEYVDELIRVIRDGDTQAELSSGSEPTVTVEGTGLPPVSHTTGQVRLHYVIDPMPTAASQRTPRASLMGTWTKDGVSKTASFADLY